MANSVREVSLPKYIKGITGYINFIDENLFICNIESIYSNSVKLPK